MHIVVMWSGFFGGLSVGEELIRHLAHSEQQVPSVHIGRTKSQYMLSAKWNITYYMLCAILFKDENTFLLRFGLPNGPFNTNH